MSLGSGLLPHGRGVNGGQCCELFHASTRGQFAANDVRCWVGTHAASRGGVVEPGRRAGISGGLLRRGDYRPDQSGLARPCGGSHDRSGGPLPRVPAGRLHARTDRLQRRQGGGRGVRGVQVRDGSPRGDLGQPTSHGAGRPHQLLRVQRAVHRRGGGRLRGILGHRRRRDGRLPRRSVSGGRAAVVLAADPERPARHRTALGRRRRCRSGRPRRPELRHRQQGRRPELRQRKHGQQQLRQRQQG